MILEVRGGKGLTRNCFCECDFCGKNFVRCINSNAVFTFHNMRCYHKFLKKYGSLRNAKKILVGYGKK